MISIPHTFVVSLAASTAKRAESIRQLEKYDMPYTIFDAVRGADLSKAEVDRHYDVKQNARYFKRTLTNAEIGCYYSHLAIWEIIANGQADVAVVLEDDFRFTTPPRTFFKAIEMLDLVDVFLKIDAPIVRGSRVSTKPLGGFELIQSDLLEPRTTGYLIGRNAARRLLQARRKFGRPVDIDLKHLWEHGVTVFTVTPAVIVEAGDAVQTSSIEVGRNASKSGSRLVRLWRNLRYQRNFRTQRAANKLLPHKLDL